MSSLFIVESPAKCKKIQGFLGPGWTVVATMGHIRALDDNLDAVGIDRDFDAKYAFLKEKAKAIASLKDAAKGKTRIFLASDDDREGEAISFSVAVLLGLPPATTPRVVFHEITKDAIQKAVASPRTLDMNRVNAQQARAILDMMVGFTISPLLWKYVGSALSAGRCQTPALRLLVDREREIRSFASETSWRVAGTWCAATFSMKADMIEDLENQESAENYLENLHDDAGGLVDSADTFPRSAAPPKPLITSTLQQEASALFSMQPKATMSSAQRLYENGYITYMRTDSPTLSEDAIKEVTAWISKEFGVEYLGSSKKAKAAAPVAAQEAHEAIRPTHVETTDLPVTEDWSAIDKKVYKLIWQRTVQSLMAASRGEERIVKFHATGDPGEFVWQASWKRTTFPGWKRIGQAAVNLDEEETVAAEDAAIWKEVSKIKPQDPLTWTTLTAEPHETKAPTRHTEATLVRELERRGIGRPSTFANLVGTLIEKAYATKEDKPHTEVEVKHLSLAKPGVWPPTTTLTKKKVGAEKQKMSPTTLGLSVHDFCIKEFPHLFEYKFTEAMETRLDTVAKGDEEWKALCRDTWASYKEKWTALNKGKSTAEGGAHGPRHFGEIKAIQTKKGPLLLQEAENKDNTVFFGWPPGVSFQEITEEQVVTFIQEKKALLASSSLGTHKGQPIYKKSGPFGVYAEWTGTKVPFTEEDTFETIVKKLEEKGKNSVHTLGPFEFRNGPYGLFMFKKDLVGKARKFVSLPQGLDPKALTETAAVKIYQTGLQTKAKAKNFGNAQK